MRCRVIAVVVGAVAFGVGVAGPARADVTWLCHPGMSGDPCEIALDTTVTDAGGTRVDTPPRVASEQRPIDCFYVYPTVSNQLGVNATKARDPELVSIAEYQAARFSMRCRMFAPIYRQVPLAGIPGLALGDGPGTPIGVAYGDVLEAWRAYLAHDNDGRGVVLIGHSQGSLMLRHLLRTEIETHPAQLRLLVGAVLLGGNVTVRQGQALGGDFQHVPVCTRQGQSGCVVAYSTYSTDPPPVSFFGNTNTDLTAAAFNSPTGPGYQVACTDPGLLSGISGPVGVTIPSAPFAAGPINAGIVVTNGGPPPTASTTWVEPADREAGACKTINGAHVYRYDPVAGSHRPNEFPPAWGTHLLDMNLGLERLTTIVGRQADSWLASELNLGTPRRNPRHGTARLTVTVPGAGTIAIVASGAVAGRTRSVDGPQIVALTVVPRGAARRRLARRGRARVRVSVRYRPAVGQATMQTTRVTLVQRPNN